jgi:hypothetical protein
VARPCRVVIDTVGHSGRQVEVRKGETNLFAGGGVRAHCSGTSSTLAADSIAWFAGVGRLDLLGQVKIRDTAFSIDAMSASYFLRQERLEAHKDVVAVTRPTGSVLRGPNLTLYRAAPGIRDTSEMYATTRPTITYRPSPDSGEPYIIVGDRVRMKGNDRMWAGGNVTIDRSDLSTRSDSLMRNDAVGIAALIGRPQVRGQGVKSYVHVGSGWVNAAWYANAMYYGDGGSGYSDRRRLAAHRRHHPSRDGESQAAAGVRLGRLVPSRGAVEPAHHRGRLARARRPQ